MSRITNDVDIDYQSNTYSCKPDFRFIDSVEKRVNIQKLMFRPTETLITEIVWTLYCALKGGGASCVYEDFGDEYMQNLKYYNKVFADLMEKTLPEQKGFKEDSDIKKNPK